MYLVMNVVVDCKALLIIIHFFFNSSSPMDVNSSSTADSTVDIDLICSLSKLLNTGPSAAAAMFILLNG